MSGRRFLAAMTLSAGPVVRDSLAMDRNAWIAVTESQVWAETIADALNQAERCGELEEYDGMREVYDARDCPNC